jgi:hypothetical protein
MRKNSRSFALSSTPPRLFSARAGYDAGGLSRHLVLSQWRRFSFSGSPAEALNLLHDYHELRVGNEIFDAHGILTVDPNGEPGKWVNRRGNTHQSRGLP